MLNLFYYDFGVRLIKPDPNIYYRTLFEGKKIVVPWIVFEKIYDSFIFSLTSEKMNGIINTSSRVLRASFLGGR